MKVLITGITGMTGSHLAEYLLTLPGVNVHGAIRWQDSLAYLSDIEANLVLHNCDLRDAYGVGTLIKSVLPDQVYHLAAETSVANSWKNPDQTITNNITCQLNLFEAVRRFCPKTRILVTGSSESYGLVSDNDLPVDEDTGFKPLSPYGVSKVSQDVLAYQYHKSYDMDIVRIRVFNLTGPRQSNTFSLANFARQLALIGAGKKAPVLRVGNLDAFRDFTDFRDVVKAYWLALKHCLPGEAYNIGSGTAIQLRHALEQLVEISNLNVRVETDPARMRPSDIPHMVCDNSKFCLATGWSPAIAFKLTLTDLFTYWQTVVKESQ